ncbi:class II fumarate hydratase [Cerasicoccus fimbriatus]|uniref:class II fumarate hydratase n=1 Tax=Cerasicoccus fimbriatus TaxID=3014554 RepID=UPI0022B56CDA|nr:class II fumarate hydratase [Cerasicoccus sp. TK19100]
MRIEKDSMGAMEVPEDALYGASTQRAVLNFPISGRSMPEGFIRGLGIVKAACATANEQLDRLSKEKADYIRQVCAEVAEGKLSEHFPVDVFQTGSGTSSNMNLNEVVANRAAQLAGKPIGGKDPVHPNDDVNLGQSSNDIVPTVLHVSLAVSIKENLVPALKHLHHALDEKAKEFADVIKIGRTHLMDATPVSLGQEFSGYAHQLAKAVVRAEECIDRLEELAIGGTTVGTGLNCHPEFSGKVCAILAEETGIGFREAENHFEAQAARDDCVEVAGILTTIAASLTKVANDIRLLGSGPRSGLGEISLPPTQPGSSIMPGKVNPVMSEMLVQVCMYVMGHSNTVAMAGRDGHFELNVTIPLIAHCLHESVTCLSNGARTFADKCVDDITPNTKVCQELVERSLMLVTALNPFIGYDKAAHVAKRAFKEGKTLKDILLDEQLMEEAQIDQALDPTRMI